MSNIDLFKQFEEEHCEKCIHQADITNIDFTYCNVTIDITGNAKCVEYKEKNNTEMEAISNDRSTKSVL